MSSGTTTRPRFEAREVLLAKIAFPNGEIKQRPILVISKFSSVIFNPPSSILICLAITSNTNSDPHMIQIRNADMEENTFPRSSQVVCDNIFTILKTDVVKRIGKVKPNFYETVIGMLKTKILDI